MSVTELFHRRRAELMGFAIFMVVCFHAEIRTHVLPLDYLLFKDGNMGVDIFALMAGFGCAFSLAKDDRFGRFYARRLARLLPPYYVALLLLLLLFGCPSPEMFVAHVIPIGVWVGHSAAYWYISATLLYYALVPGMRDLIVRARRPRWMAAALMLVFALAVPFAATDSGPSIAVARFPALTLGVALGVFWHMRRGRRDDGLDLALVLGTYALGLFMVIVRKTGCLDIPWFETGTVRRLHQDLRVPVLALALAAVFEGLERTPLRGVNAVLRHLGKHSLDIYMSHVIVRNLAIDRFGLSGFPLLAAMLALSYPLALGIDWAGGRLLGLAKKLPLFREVA